MKKSIKLIAVLALAVVLATSAISLTACGEKMTLPEATGLVFEQRTHNNETYYVVVGIGTETLKEFSVPSKYEGVAVEAIAEKAFEGTDIVSIELPKSITWIEERAFNNCSSLKSITALGVTYIAAEAFRNCRFDSVVLQHEKKWARHSNNGITQGKYDFSDPAEAARILSSYDSHSFGYTDERV